MNSRYELKQDNKFCGDIWTLFQSHCQTRMIVCCYQGPYGFCPVDDDNTIKLHALSQSIYTFPAWQLLQSLAIQISF